MKISNKEYREHPAVSRSDLNVLLTKTPLHLKYNMEHPREDTQALSFGRAAHKYILEKESFFEEFAIMPNVDRRTKDGKAFYAKFVDSLGNKEPISEDDYNVICDMAAAIDANPMARALLTGETEQSFFWTDNATGEQCKVRPDCLSEFYGRKFITDYKTTDSCSDGMFERSVRKYGYKFQAGMYREGMFHNTLDDYKFAFVAQEKTAPYAVRVYICSDEFCNEGYDQFREAIGIYHYCKQTGNWYGYEGIEETTSELVGEGEREC